MPSAHLAVAPAGADGLAYGLQTVLPDEFTYVPFGQDDADDDGAGAGAT